MPTDAEQIATIKSNLLAKLAEVSANPKPNYNVDGQQVSWGDYYKMLWEQVAQCDKQLAATEPFEIITYEL